MDAEINESLHLLGGASKPRGARPVSYFIRSVAAAGAAALMLFTLPFVSCELAQAKFKQQGHKLVGIGAVGQAFQGDSVALSADGNTAIVGGANDNSGIGAAWVFTRSNGIWKKQGNKLVPDDAIGEAALGVSAALSADGNTAIVGGISDNSGIGAAWVFTRSNGVWTQQGAKLVGTGAVGTTFQGNSVALSADGNTAIVGGPRNNSNAGAVWVFTRSNGVWKQQGHKLIGHGAVGQAFQGTSVALSGDGNTAMVGGAGDNSSIGAVWVFTRSDGIWTQQGNKLVGTNAAGQAAQGASGALSSDGNTAIVGGAGDDSGTGATWIFRRSNDVWTQRGNKLVGGGAVGPAHQGFSVAVSADGNTALIGGLTDGDNLQGAAWVFTRGNGSWQQDGRKLVGTGAVGGAQQGFSVALSADGNTAIVGGVQDNSGAGAAWVFVDSPSVTDVSPSSGPAAGGTAVVITGTNFTGATAVKFGTTNAAAFHVKNATTLVAHTPGHANGPVDVTVTTSAGTGTKAGAFTFQ